VRIKAVFHPTLDRSEHLLGLIPMGRMPALGETDQLG
jgi:hypothetical protein